MMMKLAKDFSQPIGDAVKHSQPLTTKLGHHQWSTAYCALK